MTSSGNNGGFASAGYEMNGDQKIDYDVQDAEYASSRGEDTDFARFGYKPELERRFGLWSMVGFSCTIMVTWEGILTIFSVGLQDGGPAGLIYGFLFCWVGYTAVVASLAELVSMTPTSGGQYHWTYELYPPRWRKFVSWFTGWQLVCAWQADLAAVFYLCGTILQGLITLNYPDYHAQRWHGTLLLWVVILVGIAFNTLLARLLPWVEGSILIIHVVGFFVVMIPLVYLGDHVSAHDVFARYLTIGGYSPGLSWFVGLITTVFGFLGADGAIHMSEEVKQARTAVPNALMASVAVNGVLGFAMMVAILFVIGDDNQIMKVLTPTTNFTFIDVFVQALDSNGFATGLTALLLFLFIFAAVAVMCATSRVTWAFARDNGLPGSSWIKKVEPKTSLPLYSIGLSAIISMLLSLINIGSSVAFNAIVSLVVAAYFGSYFMAIIALAYKRATSVSVKMGPWNLGKYGLFVNIFALCWLALLWAFSFFPVAVAGGVTIETMNWSSTLWGGLMICGLGWYFVYQRKYFTGPNILAVEDHAHYG